MMTSPLSSSGASWLMTASIGASGSKFFRDLRGAIEHRNRKTLRFQIQSEVLAHYGQADQSNITLIRIHFDIFFSYSLKRGGQTHCNEHLNLMANPVCEVLVTDAQLNAPGNHVDLAAGAAVDFRGIVRGLEDGREIEGIDYEAHRKMAEHQLRQIAEEATIQFDLRSGDE